MLQKLLLGLPALVVGMGLAVQSLLNAGLARDLGSSVVAAAISFWVGAATLTLVSAFTGGVAPAFAAIRTANPVWLLGGGVLGAVFILTVTLSVPRLGVAVTMAFVIAGQLLASVLLDHFGALGVAQNEISGGRILGVVLLLAGAMLVRFS